MSAPTKSFTTFPSSVQYLNDGEGNPLYAVLPFADFQALEASMGQKMKVMFPTKLPSGCLWGIIRQHDHGVNFLEKRRMKSQKRWGFLWRNTFNWKRCRHWRNAPFEKR